MAIRLNRFKTKSLVLGVASTLMLSASQMVNAAEIEKFKLDFSNSVAGTALLELAEKSGAQIIFSQDIGKKFRTAKVSGEYTLESALSAMLKDSGLVYEFLSEDSVVIKEQESDQVEENVQLDEVVVTGSRLRTNRTYAPVQTITREDIQKRGFSSMEQLLRSVSQNQSSLNSATSLENSLSPTGAQGNSAVDLRGLGSGNTLVLVNGRRVSNAAGLGTSKGANIGGIPLAAVERVEVMTDGGSAIYGSDAVAGTVNIILRKNYNGSETSVRYEDSANGGDTYSLSQMFGSTWGSGNATINLSYQKDKPVINRKLGFTSSDLTHIGGSDGRFDMFTIAQGAFWPGYGYYAAGTPGALGAEVDLENFTIDDIDPAAIRKIDYVATYASTESERKSIVFNLTQEITPTLEAHLDFSYNETETYGISGRGPSFFNAVVPADAPTNPTGEVLVLGGTLYEAAEKGLIPKGESLGHPSDKNISAGINWEMPISDWRLSADYSESTSKSEIGFTNTFVVDGSYKPAELNAALASGLFNPFDIESNSPEVFDAILGTLYPDNPENSVNTFNTYVEGRIADIPMGEMRFVLGGEYREETSSGFSGNFTNSPTRDTTSIFGEISLPLINESHNIPLINSLDVKLAARWEEYDVRGEAFNASDSATTPAQEKFENTSPNIQLSWYVSPEFRVNASIGESFRAPGASQLFGGAIQSTFTPMGVFDPRKPDTNGEGGIENVHVFYASNPELQPETSKTTSFSINWAPADLGLVVDMAYSKIDFSDRISYLSIFNEDVRNRILNDPANDELFAPRSVDGTLQRLVSRPINVASAIHESIDMDVRYDIDTELGWFEVRLNGSYVLKHETFSAPDAPAVDVVGTDRGNADTIKGSATFSWHRNNYGTSLTYNYASSYDNTEYNSETGSYDVIGGIEGLSSWDLTGFYELEQGWKITAGARNLLNEKPPVIALATLPYDPRRVDPRGRVVYAEVTKSFDW